VVAPLHPWRSVVVRISTETATAVLRMLQKLVDLSLSW